MKKSKQNKTQKNNNNVDSNEIARQIAIETIKDLQISLKVSGSF